MKSPEPRGSRGRISHPCSILHLSSLDFRLSNQLHGGKERQQKEKSPLAPTQQRRQYFKGDYYFSHPTEQQIICLTLLGIQRYSQLVSFSCCCCSSPSKPSSSETANQSLLQTRGNKCRQGRWAFTPLMQVRH